MTLQKTIAIDTGGRGTLNITNQLNSVVLEAGLMTGLCNIFLQHTSASLIVCENADSDVRRDLEVFMSQLVPDGHPDFRHTAEGADDMPAHVRSILTQTSLCVPIIGGQLGLGTWQGIYLWEHRTSAHRRRIIISISA